MYSIGFLRLIGRNFKDLLFIGFLCSTNEHNIPTDLNRFQVVSRGVDKVQENVLHIAETNNHIKSDSCGQFDK